MKKTYEELKENNDLRIADWFQLDIPYPYHALNEHEDFIIVRETEKAVLITVDICAGDWEGTKNCWVPKKAFESSSEYEANFDKFVNACKEYNELVARAKLLGVKKVHTGLKKETIYRLAKEQGIEL